MRRTIQTLISMRLHPDIFTRTEHHINGSGGFLIATPAPLTLPPTIAASHLPLRPVLPHFCVTPSFADMCPRGSREPWTSIAAILSGHPRPARRALLSPCPILRGPAPPPPLSGEGAGSIGVSNLTLDGGGIPLPARRGLVHCISGRDIRITDCEITGSGGNGIWLENVSGDVSGNIITKSATTAILSFDAQGLSVARNTILGTNDNGIEILRTAIGDDGTLVADNRIEDIKAGPGGSGQYGNAINAFRAGNVIVRGNRIRNCDYSAVRGNSASNIQITGNSVSDVREVALYSEFSFEGAVIANNTVDGAALGVSVCNFNEGGRIAVVQGNIIRNLLPKRPIGTAPDDDAGIGVYVEADTSVSGNVIENAPSFGIVAGWGKYLRDVVISGNVIRKALAGIGLSMLPGAAPPLSNTNTLSER